VGRLDDLTDGPHPHAPTAPTPERGEVWPTNEIDGDDTYLWSLTPLEIGVVSKFELSAQDVYKRRIVGDWFEVSGRTDVRDVVVAVEEHFVDTLGFVRVVRCAAPTPEDPGLARGHAVRMYLF
jgi:hypothetical protein